MRFLYCLAISMLASTVVAQDANTTLPPEFFSGPQIAEGAARSFAELEAKVAAKERLIAELQAIVKELEAKLDCVCGEGCQCDAGGSPCPCARKQSQKPHAKITMVWMNGCDTCEKWWREQRPRYEAMGWVVDRPEKAEALNKTYPYWRVCIGDSCKEIPWVQFHQLDAKVQTIVDAQK